MDSEEGQDAVLVTLGRSNAANPAGSDSLIVELASSDAVQSPLRALKTEPLRDKVIGLREWGGRRVFSLRAPQHPQDTATADTAALQLSRGSVTTAQIEILFENQSWRIRDWRGLWNLKQDGRPTREVSLLPGTEVTIAGRTFIAESPRSIALRNFCSRLLGWSDDRIAVVDHALRTIRQAAAGRAPLTLTGTGDLVPIAHAIHRYSLGDSAPFVVSDPRRKTTVATVRSPANCASSVEGLRKADGGTLCVRARRLPRDFGEVLMAFRQPEYSARLTICSLKTLLPNASQIDIPSLESRRAELPRIVSEYVEDAAHVLQAADDCLAPQDIAWILDHAAFGGEHTISGIEKAALRAVALKITKDLTGAAKLLGMARVSLERWIKRRGDDPMQSTGGAGCE